MFFPSEGKRVEDDVDDDDGVESCSNCEAIRKDIGDDTRKQSIHFSQIIYLLV